MKGTIKWFNSQKGYGFISDETGNDVFLHYTGLNMNGFKTIDEGQEVEFDVVEGDYNISKMTTKPGDLLLYDSFLLYIHVCRILKKI